MNESLTKTFTREDVETAIKQMAPLKSPRPDGYGACFYQPRWHQVGEEGSKAVLACLNENIFDLALNYTYIALISKVSSPKLAFESRPINLYNVIYKIVTKVLANKLGILSEIISLN